MVFKRNSIKAVFRRPQRLSAVGIPHIEIFRRDQSMLSIRHQVFTKCLSSAIFLVATVCSGEVGRVTLGLVSLQTVVIAPDGSGRMSGGVIVRLVNVETKAESFVLSNTEGIDVVPVRPGKYCYDAFSQKGDPLTLKRPASERCFSVSPDEMVEVGVEFKKQ
jgi:hypothetical protein